MYYIYRDIPVYHHHSRVLLRSERLAAIFTDVDDADRANDAKLPRHLILRCMRGVKLPLSHGRVCAQ